MRTTLLLLIHTAQRHYIVRREQIDGLFVLSANWAVDAARPLLYRDLGPLLDPDDQPAQGRCHVLLVSLRRRSVGLLIERADDLAQLPADQLLPLAPLLARNLSRPWVTGVCLRDDTPVLVLDLACIARDVALGAV
jgi:chemotaxis signal transduction protein